ncbi:MAG: hypothetical protein ACO1PI_10185 [Bacteroidota bacterium]
MKASWKRFIKFLKTHFKTIFDVSVVLIPLIVSYLIIKEPFKKVAFCLDTYEINNALNSLDVYEDTVSIYRVKNILINNFDIDCRKIGANQYYSPSSSDSTFYEKLSIEIIEEIWKQEIKDLKIGQYELVISIQNLSNKTFKNPTLHINSDFIYTLKPYGGKTNLHLMQINGNEIPLGEILKPSQVIETFVVTKDNMKTDVSDGRVTIHDEFPDIYLTVDDEVIFPTFSERIYYANDFEGNISRWLVNYPTLQIIGYTFVGIGIISFFKTLLFVFYKKRPPKWS